MCIREMARSRLRVKREGERWIVLGLGYQRLTPRETPGRLEQRKEMALIAVSLTQPSVI